MPKIQHYVFTTHGFQAWSMINAYHPCDAQRTNVPTNALEGMGMRDFEKHKTIALELPQLISAVYPFYQQFNDVQWLPRAMLSYLHQTYIWRGVPAFTADTVLSEADEATLLAGVVPWHSGTNHTQWPGELRVFSNLRKMKPDDDVDGELTVIIRATAFGTFHGVRRQDAVAFLAPYRQQDVMKFDPHKATHRRRIGYAFVVMFFSCRVQVAGNPAPVTKDLALIEELWHLPCREQADMAENYGVEYLYRVCPRRIYYVIDVNRIQHRPQ